MIRLCEKCGTQKTSVKKGDGVRWRCRPCEAEYQRKHYHANIEKMRTKSARNMAKYRADPESRERILQTQRKAYRNGGALKQRQRITRMQKEEPFRWRAYLLRKLNDITAADLEMLWNKQDGKCGLTGRVLTIGDADIDHIIPKSRGGSSDLSNLRWVWSRANEAKGNMTDEEFVILCNEVAEYIGRCIVAHYEATYDHQCTL